MRDSALTQGNTAVLCADGTITAAGGIKCTFHLATAGRISTIQAPGRQDLLGSQPDAAESAASFAAVKPPPASVVVSHPLLPLSHVTYD